MKVLRTPSAIRFATRISNANLSVYDLEYEKGYCEKKRLENFALGDEELADYFEDCAMFLKMEIERVEREAKTSTP